MKPLDDEQRERVRQALRSCGADLSGLRTPEELHAFVLNYDSYWPLRVLHDIVTDPLCDQGTALCAYWNVYPLHYYEKYARADEVEPGDREVVALMREIERRTVSGFYTNRSIRYDPGKWRHAFTGESIRRMLEQRPLRQPIPPYLLEPSPGEPPDRREWFLIMDDRTGDTLMNDTLLDAQVAELRDLLAARVGYPEELYPLVVDGGSVLDRAEADEDEGDAPLPRVLCPPVPEETVRAAEERLGFFFPPLLRAVYTCIGNGGLCLGLLGLEGGQTGGEDLFPGMSVIEIYETLDRWRREGDIPYLPPRLLPIDDALGCGMVDYVDCRTDEGKIWRTDSGSLIERQPTLYQYFREAIESYGDTVGGEG